MPFELLKLNPSFERTTHFLWTCVGWQILGKLRKCLGTTTTCSQLVYIHWRFWTGRISAWSRTNIQISREVGWPRSRAFKLRLLPQVGHLHQNTRLASKFVENIGSWSVGQRSTMPACSVISSFMNHDSRSTLSMLLWLRCRKHGVKYSLVGS